MSNPHQSGQQGFMNVGNLSAGIVPVAVGGPGLPPGWLALKELWLSTAGGPDRVGGLETPHPEAAGTKLLSHFTEGTINNLAKVTQVGEIAFMNGVQVISTFGFLPLSPGNLE